MKTSPSYKGLKPASERASKAARASSRKKGTRCELLLRRALWHQGCRFRTHVPDLPGRPDIVFTKAKLAIFCDGDFWHGNNWPTRKKKLESGTNASYWIAKIQRNMQRDLTVSSELRDREWIVLRFWESEIRTQTDKVCALILDVLDSMGHRKAEPQLRTQCRRTSQPIATGTPKPKTR